MNFKTAKWTTFILCILIYILFKDHQLEIIHYNRNLEAIFLYTFLNRYNNGIVAL